MCLLNPALPSPPLLTVTLSALSILSHFSSLSQLRYERATAKAWTAALQDAILAVNWGGQRNLAWPPASPMVSLGVAAMAWTAVR